MMKVETQPQRLQKYLAQQGIGSRREIEKLITAGAIKVNGAVAKLGDKVTAAAKIHIHNKLIPPREIDPAATARALMYNKPEGEICTRYDPRGRRTVYKNLPPLTRTRWIAVGRLDINTRGLLLFTTDGAVANQLMHPKYAVEREYLCRVYGEVARDAAVRLRRGVCVDGETLRAVAVRRVHPPEETTAKNNWYAVVVTAGKYRAVRRMWSAVGGRVSRLIRVRYGVIKLPQDLPPGRWRELDVAELRLCIAAASPPP